MKSIAKMTILFALFHAGCDHDVPGNLPPIKPVSELPVFTEQENEIEIADSFNNTDLTMVLGATVDLTNGRVHPFDTFLKKDGKTNKEAKSELAFKNFLENSVVADAEWLTFLKGQVSDSIRAEVTITETSNASISISSIDENKLQAFAQNIAEDKRDDYGVVIAYRDFVISASLFKEQSVEGNTSGYGAKIGGKWFGKHEGVTADHRIVAVWAPLPFVVEKIGSSNNTIRAVPLTTLTTEAMRNGKISIRPSYRQRKFALRPHP